MSLSAGWPRSRPVPTGHRTRLVRRDLIPLAGLALTLLCSAASPARADDCGPIDTRGQCQDAETLSWCDQSGGTPTLRTAHCPAGEMCASHEDFDGVLCLAFEETECGREGVPVDRDICTTGNAVAFCSDGRVGLDPCGAEEVCRIEPSGNGDCIPRQATSNTDAYAGAPDADAGGSAPDADPPAEADPGPEDLGPPAPGDGASDHGPGPTPGLTQGEPYTIPAGGGGCSSGAPSPSLAICAFLALLWLAARRRQRLTPSITFLDAA